MLRRIIFKLLLILYEIKVLKFKINQHSEKLCIYSTYENIFRWWMLDSKLIIVSEDSKEIDFSNVYEGKNNYGCSL